MCLIYNLITLTVNSLGLFQVNLTLKTDVYFTLLSFFGAKNGCNEDLVGSICTHGI